LTAAAATSSKSVSDRVGSSVLVLAHRCAAACCPGGPEDAVKGLRPETLSGPRGLLSQLAGRVVEAALKAGSPTTSATARRSSSSGNVRNGATAKRLQTDVRPVDIKTPRDRDGRVEPKLVAKRQTRLAGLDDKSSCSTPAG